MTWRYQVVWTTDLGGRCYSICEVYFDKAGKLKAWTRPFMDARGETPDELRGDIIQMLVDCYRWKPVSLKSLKVGRTFERAVSQEQFDALAKLVHNTAHNMGEAMRASSLSIVDGGR